MSNWVQKRSNLLTFFDGNKTQKLSSGGVFDETEGFMQQLKALNNFVVNDNTGRLVGRREREDEFISRLNSRIQIEQRTTKVNANWTQKQISLASFNSESLLVLIICCWWWDVKLWRVKWAKKKCHRSIKNNYKRHQHMAHECSHMETWKCVKGEHVEASEMRDSMAIFLNGSWTCLEWLNEFVPRQLMEWWARSDGSIITSYNVS